MLSIRERFDDIVLELLRVHRRFLDYIHSPEPLEEDELESLMAAIDDLNTIVATLQSTATEVAAAFAAADNSTAIEAAVTTLQGVNSTLSALVPPATTPATPAA